jgi:hypothetical protein
MFAQIIGQFFLEKNSPNAIKNHPNGEILPNLVTLIKRGHYKNLCELRGDAQV